MQMLTKTDTISKILHLLLCTFTRQLFFCSNALGGQAGVVISQSDPSIACFVSVIHALLHLWTRYICLNSRFQRTDRFSLLLIVIIIITRNTKIAVPLVK